MSAYYILGSTVICGFLGYFIYSRNNINIPLSFFEKKENNQKEEQDMDNGYRTKSVLLDTKLSKDIIYIIYEMINKIYKIDLNVYNLISQKPNDHYMMKFQIESNDKIKYVEETLLSLHNLQYRYTFEFGSIIIVTAEGKGKDFLKLLNYDCILYIDIMQTVSALLN